MTVLEPGRKRRFTVDREAAVLALLLTFLAGVAVGFALTLFLAVRVLGS